MTMNSTYAARSAGAVYADAQLGLPVLTRLSLDQWLIFLREFAMKKKRTPNARLGMAYLARYSCNGYHNTELMYASDERAFSLLSSYTRYGVLKPVQAA
jgi:hypothetical protein